MHMKQKLLIEEGGLINGSSAGLPMVTSSSCSLKEGGQEIYDRNDEEISNEHASEIVDSATNWEH